jgi:hypothetical protein
MDDVLKLALEEDPWTRAKAALPAPAEAAKEAVAAKETLARA